MPLVCLLNVTEGLLNRRHPAPRPLCSKATATVCGITSSAAYVAASATLLAACLVLSVLLV